MDRVTYHNPDSGWSVLRVFPFNSPSQQETVIVHLQRLNRNQIHKLYLDWIPKYLGSETEIQIIYQRDDIPELDLAYAITIHKSQGSEFGAVIIPVLTQHFKMLFRNLIYTALTRAKNLAVFVGIRKALAMAVKNQNTSQRQIFLPKLLA
ncbi:MAG: ATP-binding domain-containing protein [Desulfobacterales bacterium]